MNLEDAINRCFEAAKHHDAERQKAKQCYDHYTELEECGKVNEYRQLAEMLTELQRYRKLSEDIADIKNEFHGYKFVNPPYRNGYVDALSMVEGLIATVRETRS